MYFSADSLPNCTNYCQSCKFFFGNSLNSVYFSQLCLLSVFLCAIEINAIYTCSWFFQSSLATVITVLLTSNKFKSILKMIYFVNDIHSHESKFVGIVKNQTHFFCDNLILYKMLYLLINLLYGYLLQKNTFNVLVYILQFKGYNCCCDKSDTFTLSYFMQIFDIVKIISDY